MPKELFVIGKILTTFGILGEVKVAPLTDIPERFHDLSSCLVGKKGVSPVRFMIEKVRYHRSVILIKFKGYDDIENAKPLRGSFLYVTEDELVVLPKDKYYVHQLIGLTVLTINGDIIGKISDILKTGANDVYVVTGETGEVLIPVIEQVVKKIDLDKGKVIIDPIEGLL